MALPMHYVFFTEVAIEIYKTAKSKNASNKGALFVIAHASLESGFAKSALKYGDYNLFGQMTLGNDFKRETKHGRVKDFSNGGKGGFKTSIEYYFSKITDTAKQWDGLGLIKKENFTFQDIDDAFNTGTDFPTDKERHGGKYAYNADLDGKGKNHYGRELYLQMKTCKKRMVEALKYKIQELDKLSKPIKSESQTPYWWLLNNKVCKVNSVPKYSPIFTPTPLFGYSSVNLLQKAYLSEMSELMKISVAIDSVVL